MQTAAYQILSRMCLNNWHYINEKVLSFDEHINFFTGHSGSGKSTIIDAMQVVLYADTDGRGFFNKAAKDDSDRTLMEYLRGMKSVQDNDEVGYLRNGNFSSAIVLEFTHSQTGKRQCTGVVFDVDVTGSGEINRLFFFHEGALPEHHYRMGRKCFSIAQMKEFLEKQKNEGEVFYSGTNVRFRKVMYDTCFGGLDPVKFAAIFKKAIPFKMDMKLEDFVRNYICMEKDIHIEEMQDSVTQYVRLKRKLEDTREEIGCLNEIHHAYDQYTAVKQKKRQCRYNADSLEIVALKQEISEAKDRQDILEQEIEQLIRDTAGLDEEIQEMKEERDTLLIRMEQSGYHNLENQLLNVNALLERLYISRAEYEKTVLGLLKWQEVGFISHTIKEHIAKTADFPAELFQNGNVSKEMAVSFERIQKGLNEERESLKEDLDDTRQELSRLKAEISSLRREIEQLEKGQKAYPDYLVDVKGILEETLRKRHGRMISVDILADLLEIKDETWRNAIEGYMGNNKLLLIVEPDFVKEAMEIYETLDAGKFYRAAVLDTEKVTADIQRRKAGSLAEEIETDKEYVQAYVDFLMGNVMKCRSIGELRQSRCGITPECILYQGYKLQHINPGNYQEQAFIGQKVIEKKLERLNKNLRRKKEDRASYEELRRNNEELLSLEALDKKTEVYLGWLKDIGDIGEREKEKVRLETEIEELKKQNVDEWRARKELLEQLISDRESLVRKKISDRSARENSRQKLKEKMLQKHSALSDREKNFIREEELEEGFYSWMAQASGMDAVKDSMSLEEKRNVLKLEWSRYNRWKEKMNEEMQQYGEEEGRYFRALIKVRAEYHKRFSFRDFEQEDESNQAYDELLSDLTEKRLPEFVDRAGELAKIAAVHFKEDFIYKIRSSIKEALEQKDELNKILRNMDFGKDKYQIIVTKNKGSDGRFYDMFMDEALEINPNRLANRMESQMNLFTMEHEEHYGELINELLDLFIPPENATAKELEDARRDMERYADYRTYLSFDMGQIVEGMPVSKLSRMLSKNSGGEGQNPLYVAVLASFAQVYRLSLSAKVRRKPTLRLVVLDEAFSKMDAEKVGSCIALIRKLGLQAIISATNDKIQNYVENVDRTFVFANPDKSRIYIQEFAKSEAGKLMASVEE